MKEIRLSEYIHELIKIQENIDVNVDPIIIKDDSKMYGTERIKGEIKYYEKMNAVYIG